MIVVISDLHFVDGTTADNVNKAAWHYFSAQIKASLKKKKCSEINIVLLGDIFDFVRTEYWLKLPKKQRPWNGILNNQFAMNKGVNNEVNYNNVLKNIFNCKDKSFDTFISEVNDLVFFCQR